MTSPEPPSRSPTVNIRIADPINRSRKRKRKEIQEEPDNKRSPPAPESHRLGNLDSVINRILGDEDSLPAEPGRIKTLYTSTQGLTDLLVQGSTSAGPDAFWDDHIVSGSLKASNLWTGSRTPQAQPSRNVYCDVWLAEGNSVFSRPSHLQFWQDFIALSTNGDAAFEFFEVVVTRWCPAEHRSRLEVELRQKGGAAQESRDLELDTSWLSQIKGVHDSPTVQVLKIMQQLHIPSNG